MLYQIKLINLVDDSIRKKLMQLQKKHKEEVAGIYGLYDELFINGYCESYNRARMLYVGYTLADNYIDFEIK